MPVLDRDQLQTLHEQLTQRQQVLRNELRTIQGHRDDASYGKLTGSGTDGGEEAVADVLIDIDNAVAGIQIEELRDIDAAFARMKNGSYGICVDCEEPVSYERLMARPTAKRCAHCQGLHEKRSSGTHRSSM